MFDATLVAARVPDLKPPVSIGDKCANCDRPSLAQGAARLTVVMLTHILQISCASNIVGRQSSVHNMYISVCSGIFQQKLYGRECLQKRGAFIYFLDVVTGTWTTTKTELLRLMGLEIFTFFEYFLEELCFHTVIFKINIKLCVVIKKVRYCQN